MDWLGTGGIEIVWQHSIGAGDRRCRPAARVARNPRTGLGMAVLSVLLSGCQMSATGHNVDGVRYFQQGQRQAALQKFQQALAANPNNADSYYNLAAAMHEWGRSAADTSLLEQAEGLYHQCLDLRPDHVECHRALAVLLVDTNRPESAFTLLQRWAARSPQVADARVELARMYEEFGDRQAAARFLTEALDVDASNARAWTALGRIREQEGRYAQALADYQQAYRLQQSQPGLAQRINHLQLHTARTGTPTQPATPRTVQVPQHWAPR